MNSQNYGGNVAFHTQRLTNVNAKMPRILETLFTDFETIDKIGTTEILEKCTFSTWSQFIARSEFDCRSSLTIVKNSQSLKQLRVRVVNEGIK